MWKKYLSPYGFSLVDLAKDEEKNVKRCTKFCILIEVNSKVLELD